MKGYHITIWNALFTFSRIIKIFKMVYHAKIKLTRNISGEAVPAEDPLAPSACAARGCGAWLVHSAVRVSRSSATSRTRSSGSRIPPELARSARTPTHVSGPCKEESMLVSILLYLNTIVTYMCVKVPLSIFFKIM